MFCTQLMNCVVKTCSISFLGDDLFVKYAEQNELQLIFTFLSDERVFVSFVCAL